MNEERDEPEIPAAPPSPHGPLPDNIGTAHMREDGVIEMMLVASEPDGTHGEALIRVDPSEERYAGIVAHLDGLKPGESCAVRPFPPE